MIEMPNSQMILTNQESSSMDSDVSITTTVMTTTQSIKLNSTMPEDMMFNAGHQLSIIVYSILMVISAIGNITVLVLLIKRRMRTPSRLDIMLTHLAIADLMVTFLLMPLEIGWAFTVQWTAGDAMCRVMMFFRTFGLYLSSFILVCISVDRFYAVLKPLNLKEHRGKIMISIAWILSAFCSAPQSLIFHVETHPDFTNFTQCVSFNVLSPSAEVAYNVICLLMMYVVPLLIIIISYCSIYYEIFQKSRMKNSDRFRRSSINVLGRAKRRTLRMTITIVIVFVVCWTPYYVMVVWFFMDPVEAKKADILLQKSLYLFACTNSCMNPIVYGVFNLKRNKTDRNTFSFNTYHSDSKRKRTLSTRTENFSRESSKTICIKKNFKPPRNTSGWESRYRKVKTFSPKKNLNFHRVMDQNRDGNGMEALLMQTVRNRLTESGDLNKIKSELRAMVLNDVRDGDKSPMNSLDANNSKSPTQIANHLVMEYLEWIGFQYSKEIFATESGTTKDASSLRSIEAFKEAGFDKELPLLLNMTMQFMKNLHKN